MFTKLLLTLSVLIFTMNIAQAIEGEAIARTKIKPAQAAGSDSSEKIQRPLTKPAQAAGSDSGDGNKKLKMKIKPAASAGSDSESAIGR